MEENPQYIFFPNIFISYGSIDFKIRVEVEICRNMRLHNVTIRINMNKV